ncbi:MAG: hypothetical protein ACYS0F_06110, partial [Planctomycetota bacterium]
MRLLISLLLLASFASAQTVDELVDRAMHATTGPKERLETMQELLKREDGDVALAKAGLDPLRDSEVVHMTVEVLLDSGRAGPHMAAICRLLLNAGHADKIKERIYRYAEQLSNGRKLVSRLSVLARGSDPAAREDIELQRAAVKALGVVPHRDAVDAIAAVWAVAKEPGIKAECEIQLRGVVLAKNGEDAVAILGKRRYATWADLIREVSGIQATRAQSWKELAKRFAEGHFKQATHEEVFRAFNKGTSLEKGAAAKRARALAESKNYGKNIGASKFAVELVNCLLTEMKSGPTGAAQDLVGALVAMNRDQAFGEKGLPLAAELRDALVAGADGGPDSAAFAGGAMELLSGMGADAMPVLAEYARRHATTAVRTAAVEALGDIASRGDAATKNRVGQLLAELLAANPPRAVRGRLLFSLRAAPSAEAVATIAKLLANQKAGQALERIEVIYSMEFLARAPAEEAGALLTRIAEQSENEKTRIDAIEHGLITRLRSGQQPEKVRATLSKLVLDPKQPKNVRLAVLNALGARGALVAAALLGEVASSENLEQEFRRVALLQQLNLAERLLKRNGDGQLTKDDLVAIARIIGDQPNDGAEAGRVLRLAKSAAEKAESLKIPGGLVRTRYAQRLEAKAGSNESELRVAWKDAADNGETDGLSERDRIHALQKFRNLAKGIDRVDADLELLKIA